MSYEIHNALGEMSRSELLGSERSHGEMWLYYFNLHLV